MRRIKRYKNRKVYDLKDKKYINLEQIVRILASGEDDVQVDEYPSKKNITGYILAEALAMMIRKTPDHATTEALKEIIRLRGMDLLARQPTVGRLRPIPAEPNANES